MRETWKTLALVASTAALGCALVLVPVALVMWLTGWAPADEAGGDIAVAAVAFAILGGIFGVIMEAFDA